MGYILAFFDSPEKPLFLAVSAFWVTCRPQENKPNVLEASGVAACGMRCHCMDGAKRLGEKQGRRLRLSLVLIIKLPQNFHENFLG